MRIHNIRDYTHDRHHTTDDTPYGGGGGMVMKPEPVFEAVEAVLGTANAHAQPMPVPIILLTPQGRVFTQRVAAIAPALDPRAARQAELVAIAAAANRA